MRQARARAEGRRRRPRTTCRFGRLPLVRIVAILAGAAAIALTAAASAAPTGRLLAIATGDAPALVWVDAATLTPLPGPRVALPPKAGGGALSPDRSTYVFGSNGEPAVTFFDVERMQQTATLVTGRVGSAYPIAWPEERRLFVEGWGCCPTHVEAVVVDPVARSVVARVALKGGGFSTVPTADGIVALLEPAKGIKPVRVVAINRDGGSRSVILSRIKGGTKWRGSGSDRTAAIRQPGFAVDRAGQAAYVIDPDGVVARVDLTTMAVSYHAKAARRLARAAKQINGPMLFARWLGDGRIAVSGTDAKLRKTSTGWHQTWTPRGVSLLDTRTWTSRMLDPIAASFSAMRDAVLIAGNGALSAYTLDGALRYKIGIPDGNAYASVAGAYGYVWTADKVTLVDLRDGGVVATLTKPPLYLIPDGS
jgi:hypothetical protein